MRRIIVGLTDRIERGHGAVHDCFLAAVDWSLVLVGTGLVRRIDAVGDHLRQEFCPRRAVAAEQTFHVEFHDSGLACFLVEKVAINGRFDAFYQWPKACLDKLQDKLLDAAALGRGAIGRVTDHDRGNTKDATDLLYVELAHLKHLRIFRIDRELLVFEPSFKDCDLSGPI